MHLLGNIILIPFKILVLPLALFFGLARVLTSIANFFGHAVLGLVNGLLIVGLIISFITLNPIISGVILALLAIGVLSLLGDVIHGIITAISNFLFGILHFWF